MAAFFKNTTTDIEQYLSLVKNQMRRYQYEDNPISGLSRLDSLMNGLSTLEPKKLDEPNDTWLWMWENRDKLKEFVVFERNNLFTELAAKTLKKSYLLKEGFNGEAIENPQFMFLRVASALHYPDIERIQQTYNDMSTLRYIPASPTLLNAGLTIPQMSSCFLIKLDDNMCSITWTMMCIALISKTNGATGISLGSLRTHSPIGNNGISKGTGQVAKIYDAITSYVDQGGRRKGATQMCQFIWHQDIQTHIGLTRKLGDERGHIHDADTSVATYNLFWKRVENNEPWSLFCPREVPGLDTLYGEAFEAAYIAAEQKGLARKVVNAVDLLTDIATVLIESGRPYVINIDSINLKSNMQNIGFISTLNLCQEIALPADNLRIPACNLSSTCLSTKVVNGKFDFQMLIEDVVAQTYNLNAVIERNYYALPQIEFANRESLPIGIGAQGFVDAVMKLDLLFDSEEARQLNKLIMACTYYNALKTSCEIAKVLGPYQRFKDSPFSKGILQFDMWGITPIEPHMWGQSGSWEDLRNDIMKYGLRNSQLTTAQPTASVSTITDNGETWEPFYSNYFTRSTQNGEFPKLNQYLKEDLEKLGLWNDKVFDWIQVNDGSIQGISSFIKTTDESIIKRLQYLEKKHRTVFEYSQKVILEMAADRGPYTDASQSTNIYMKKATTPKIANCLAYANKLGLKTLVYYLRSQAARAPIKTIRVANEFEVSAEPLVCMRTNSSAENCISCQ